MAGYIGSKAVTLSTTAADVAGNAVIDGDLTVKGTTVTIDSAAVQEIRLGDNDKMTFGDATGGDLQIYHDGSNSYIDDAGTGNLTIRANLINFDKYTGEAMARFRADGNTELFYDNAAKLATTSTGIDVTGRITTDAITEDTSGNVGIGTSSPSQSWTGGTARTVQLQGPSSTITVLRVNEASDTYGDLQLISGASNEVALYNFNNGAMRLGTNSSERMRIDSSGNVGINESSPDTKLHVSNNASQTPIATIENTAHHEATIRFKSAHSAASDFRVGASISASNNFEIYSVAAAAPRLAIDSSGNMMVGKTNVAWYDTGFQAESSGKILGVTSDTSGNNFFARKNNATGTMFAFWYNTTNIGNITSGTSSVSYNTSSDYRLKENVTDVTDGITRVKQLAPKRFNFIADPDTTVDGFIAHEAQAVVPEAVTGTKDAMRDEEYEVTPAVLDDDGNVVTEAVMGTRSVPDYQGIDQAKLVPLLTAALQEAIAKIETLETEMTSVKARLDALEGN